MDINEKLLQLEQMNTALKEAIESGDYATQYAFLKQYEEMGDNDGK